MCILLCIETANSFLQTEFDSASSSFSCKFLGNQGTGLKSCDIVYGIQDAITQSCLSSTIKSEAENSTHSFISDTVTVSIPPLAQTESEFCFVAMGKTQVYTVVVEGTFKIGTIRTHMLWVASYAVNNQLVCTLDAEGPICEQCTEEGLFLGVSLGMAALTVLFATLSIIFVIVIVILAKGKARALKELQETTQRVTTMYEEINLTPVDIDTGENVAYGHLSNKCIAKSW